MDFTEIIRLISNFLAYTSIIPLVLFVYYYGTVPIPGSKWRRKWTTKYWRQNAIGRTLMYQKLAWIAFLLFIITSLIFPEWTDLTREVVRFAIYVALPVLFWRVLYTLRQTQKGKIKDSNTGSVTTMPVNGRESAED